MATRAFGVRISKFFSRHRLLLVVLLVSAVVWGLVYSEATQDFGGSRPYRGVWNGRGEFRLFGYTIEYEFEGYVDYDYYYQSWAENFLNGSIPYTNDFNTFSIGGHDFNTPYFLPPLFLYICAVGSLLPLQPFGIGLLITLFGYLTSLPIYGIATQLSMNRRVGAVSGLSYLLNPLVLFHTAYQWLNPAPFVFFMMLSLYLLMRGKRTSGLLAMVTAALFKQIAFFLALPLIAYFIKKRPSEVVQSGAEDEKGRLISDSLDLRAFATNIVVALLYAGLVSLPYLFDPANYIFYIFERPGGVLLDDVSSLPPADFPMTFAVLLIMIGAPEWLTQFVNLATYYTIFLLAGVCAVLLLMLVERKDDRNLTDYWRRMLFLTLLLLLWIHLFSPRGIYKYYLVALAPFLSIFSVSRMVRKTTESMDFSAFMILNPLLLSLGLLFPSKYTYLAVLLVIFIGYLLHQKASILHGMANSGIRQLWKRLKSMECDDLQ